MYIVVVLMNFISVMSPVYDLLSLGKKETGEKRKIWKKKITEIHLLYIFFILNGYLVINIQVTDNLGGVWYNL